MNKHLDITPPLFSSIDIFCGGGGASSGAHMAGFQSVLGVDISTKALECYKANNSDVSVLQKPVQYVTAEDVFRITGLKRGELDHLHGSPPCVLYSAANTKAAANPPEHTNENFYHFIRLVDELKPKTFTAENVEGMMMGTKRIYFNDILKRLKSLSDYTFKYKAMNAALYGVPQDRKRVIFIGKRKDVSTNMPIKFPEPSLEGTKFMTVKMITPYIERYDPGQFRAKIKGSSNLMCTITATDKIKVCVDGNWRGLTIPEMKLFMGFPESFVMPAKSRSVNVRILGNSVPPPLMYAIMLNLKKILSEHAKNNKTTAIISSIKAS